MLKIISLFLFFFVLSNSAQLIKQFQDDSGYMIYDFDELKNNQEEIGVNPFFEFVIAFPNVDPSGSLIKAEYFGVPTPDIVVRGAINGDAVTPGLDYWEILEPKCTQTCNADEIEMENPCGSEEGISNGGKAICIVRAIQNCNKWYNKFRCCKPNMYSDWLKFHGDAVQQITVRKTDALGFNDTVAAFNSLGYPTVAELIFDLGTAYFYATWVSVFKTTESLAKKLNTYELTIQIDKATSLPTDEQPRLGQALAKHYMKRQAELNKVEL